MTALFFPPAGFVGVEAHGAVGVGDVAGGIHVWITIQGALGIDDGVILRADGGGNAIVGTEAGGGATIGITEGIHAVGHAGTGGVGCSRGGTIDVRVEVLGILGIRVGRTGCRCGGEGWWLAEAAVICRGGTGRAAAALGMSIER